MLTEDELVETMKKERHRTLKVWRDAVALARDVYAHTATFPPEERFGLTSQLRRAAVSVASNIAEGSRRLLTDNRNFLRYALGSIVACDTQLILAGQLGDGAYTRRLTSAIMSLTMGIRAYAKTLKPLPPASEASVPLTHGLVGCTRNRVAHYGADPFARCRTARRLVK